MTAAALLPALRFAARFWPLGLALSAWAAGWWLQTLPAERALSATRAALIAEQSGHAEAVAALTAEREASDAANLRARDAQIEAIRLSEALTRQTAASELQRAAIRNTIETEVDHEPTDWTRARLPDGDAYRLCVNAARLAGADHSDCGGEAGDDAGAGGGT